MCGIFGYAGPWSFRSAGLLQALAIADQVRGMHSTGIALLERDPETKKLRPHLVKRALSGREFVRQGHTRAFFQTRYHLAIGHNRFATSGQVNDRNAHPFLVTTPRGIALAAHNGCVGGKEAIAEKFGVKDYPVDSEVMFRAIAKRAGNTEEDLLHAIEEVTAFISARADFSCLWLDAGFRPARMYFWRSVERPLAVLDARKVGMGRIFASTIEIASAAWGSVRGYLPPVSKVTYFETRAYAIYRVVDDGRWEVDKVRDLKVERRVQTPSSPPTNVPFSQKSLWDARVTEPDEDAIDYVHCHACKRVLATEDAVFIDPVTGHQNWAGKPHHKECAA